jgi:hypothetical protein
MSWEEDIRIIDDGVGGLSKIVEAYIGEAG